MRLFYYCCGQFSSDKAIPLRSTGCSKQLEGRCIGSRSVPDARYFWSCRLAVLFGDAACLAALDGAVNHHYRRPPTIARRARASNSVLPPYLSSCNGNISTSASIYTSYSTGCLKPKCLLNIEWISSSLCIRNTVRYVAQNTARICNKHHGLHSSGC